MSLFSKLFGKERGSAAPAAQPVEYNGFRITPQPMSEDGGYRICALIESEVDGEPQSHLLIRADVIRDADEAYQASLGKAKQMIDQMGTRLFKA